MLKLIHKMSRKVAQAPGTLIHIGEPKIEKVNITVTRYDQETLKEENVDSLEGWLPEKKSRTVNWLNIDGIHEVESIRQIGDAFGIHPLVLEDIVNTGQRPKLENFENHMFVVSKMLYYDAKINEVTAEHVSFIIGPNTVISFQERQSDVFDPVRQRLRKARGRIRKMGADYLFYSLLDAVVDNYFVVLERLGEQIEEMEDDMVESPRPETLQAIHRLKREMIFLRKSIWPLREVVNSLTREETPLIQKSTVVYLRDVYDHTIQVIETTESLRDMVAGMQDLYLSSVSNKMNEVMKLLTIIATIFIPLTFIAGIYGMNFNAAISPFNMPELNLPFGYLIVWGVMILVALVMVIYFRRKRWL